MVANPVENNVFGLNADLTDAEKKQLRKKDLHNLLTSYADEADLFAEIIQNAFDSVATAGERGLYTASDKPTIQIFIGRRSGDTHYFAVSDNGIGMSPEVLQKFTIPGFSANKSIGKTIGYKGVGASFFVAASSKISIRSVSQVGVQTAMTVANANAWIMNETEPEPTVVGSPEIPSYVLDHIGAGRGTVVCYYLHPHWKPTTLSHVVLTSDNASEEIGNWASYLCAKTALGPVNDVSTLGIRVHFHLDRGGTQSSEEWSLGEFKRDERKLGYPYPWRVLGVSVEKTWLAALSPAKAAQNKNKHQAVHMRWTRADLQALAPKIDFLQAEDDLIADHLDFVDVFFAHSTEVLTQVQERLASRAAQIRYGIRIAVDGVPQGRMFEFDLTSNQGLSRQAHAVVAFKRLELDTGRKIPADEIIAEVIRKIGVRAISELSEDRFYLRKKYRPAPSNTLADWQNRIKHERTNSLVYALFQGLGSNGPIQVNPESENDVIALFCGMLTSDLLKGYRLHALSGYNMYDGLVAIDLTSETLRVVSDPLSIRDSSISIEGEFKVIEFKHLFEGLLDDFDEGKKNAADISLLVCWDLPEVGIRRGTIQYCFEDRADLRPAYGVSHIWTDDNQTTQIPVICLRHVTAILLKSHEQQAGGSPGLGALAVVELLNRDKQASI